MDPYLSTTQVAAAVTQVLLDGGYTRVDDSTKSSRLFEDPFGIVAVHVYDTWERLTSGWYVAQGDLVETISGHLRRGEMKAWEGYLVLFTPGFLPTGQRPTLNDLRADTNRVRKLVATGDDLSTLEEVRSALLPLLPLELGDRVAPQPGLLQTLPDLLIKDGIPRPATEAVVAAFTSNGSILDRLHTLSGEQ